MRVKLHTLSTSVLALFAATAGTPRGAWVTATAYALRDVVTINTNTYLCCVAHTSGTFATDLAAVKWLLIALGAAPTAAGIAFTPTATIAATTIQTAIDEADTENRALSSAASTAAAAASALATSTNTAIRADILNVAGTAGKGDSLVGMKRVTPTGGVATTVHAFNEARELNAVSDFGIVADGATDQTTALTALLTALGVAGFRGWLHIPYSVKFTVATVYAAVPTGVMLDDESSIGWGQPPTYKNKFRILHSGDLAADDTQQILSSGHHPARMMMNWGTAGTSSATGRFMTELYAIGRDYAGDPLTTLLRQHKKDGAGSRWMFSTRLETPYSVAIKNPQNWATATVYAAAAYCISDNGRVYTTTAGGTSGGVAPTGTGTGINDGGVLWNYVAAALALDSTIHEHDEEGTIRQYGVPALSSVVRYTWSMNSRQVDFTINGTTHDVTMADTTRGLTIYKITDTLGMVLDGGVRSFPWLTVSGATPTLAGSYAQMTNAGATTVTNILLPGTQTQGYVRMLFMDANTTLQHGANIVIKGAANVTPAAGSFMEFIKNTSFSSAWREVSRSF
jgi:hypothetical protein